MKVLVTGGSGVIGSKLVKYFIEKNIDVEFTYLKNKPIFGSGYLLDITQKEDTMRLISHIKPDVVIHTTALTNVDLCETNTVMADSINVNGTSNIINGCQITKSKLVYLSTSFVFDGKKESYHEEELASPSTYYGITKYKGEQLVKNSGLPHLILRTDQPYCWIEKWQHTNSVLRAIQTLQSGNILKEITDWYNTPTYVPDFVEATSRLLEYGHEGTFHLVGPSFINRYDWSLITAEVFGLDKNLIEPITSNTLKLPAKRVNVNLSNQKLFKKTGMQMMDIKEGLIQMLESDIR